MHKVINVTLSGVGGSSYLIGDQAGVPTVVSGVMRSTGGQAVLKSLTLVNSTNTATGTSYDAWFFKSLPTTVDDNDVFSLSEDQLELALGHIKIVAGDYSPEGTSTGVVACVRNINLMLEAAVGSTDIAVVLVVRGGATLTAGALSLVLGVEQL